MHETPCAHAGEIVFVKGTRRQFEILDWWDREDDRGWRDGGDPWCIVYRTRVSLERLPDDDEVLYGFIGSRPCLMHYSELDFAGLN